MADKPGVRALIVDWTPSAILAVAAGHELLYNNFQAWDWVLAQTLVWLLMVRRRFPELVLLATFSIALVEWLSGPL